MKTIVIGPFPPPVHGSSKNLLAITEEIEKLSTVVRVSTSPGSIQKKGKYHFLKLFRVIRALFILIRTSGRRLYMTPDAGLGMLYSVLFLMIAKLKSMDTVIHHRSFAYINKKNNLMTLCNKLTKDGTHVFLCNAMRDNYGRVYELPKSNLVVSNARQVKPASEIPKRSFKAATTLGYLSNLTTDKGFDVTLELFRKLKGDGYNVKLNIAGPVADRISGKLLSEILKDYPESTTYFGPVYDMEKTTFLRSIDVFVFPTNYKNEAQPNVIFEAMSSGAAISSTNIGCLDSDVCNAYGVTSPPEEFIVNAYKYISSLIECENKMEHARQSSLETIIKLKASSESGHSLLLKRLTE